MPNIFKRVYEQIKQLFRREIERSQASTSRLPRDDLNAQIINSSFSSIRNEMNTKFDIQHAKFEQQNIAFDQRLSELRSDFSDFQKEVTEGQPVERMIADNTAMVSNQLINVIELNRAQQDARMIELEQRVTNLNVERRADIANIRATLGMIFESTVAHNVAKLYFTFAKTGLTLLHDFVNRNFSLKNPLKLIFHERLAPYEQTQWNFLNSKIKMLTGSIMSLTPKEIEVNLITFARRQDDFSCEDNVSTGTVGTISAPTFVSPLDRGKQKLIFQGHASNTAFAELVVDPTDLVLFEATMSKMSYNGEISSKSEAMLAKKIMQLERQIVFFSVYYNIPWDNMKDWIFVGLSHLGGRPDGIVEPYMRNFIQDYQTTFPCVHYLLQKDRFKSVGITVRDN